MDIFLAGTDVTAVVPLVDRAGNKLNVSSVACRVVDQNNNEVVAKTGVASFVPGSDTVTITVPASVNAVAAGSTHEVRSIELTCVIAGNTQVVTYGYGLRPIDPLVVGVNSFQTYAQAQLSALEIPNLPGWDGADEDDRTAALIDARSHIVQLSFTLLNSNINFGQDSLNYIPEGQFVSKYVAQNSLFMFNGNLELLNAQQYSALPERFKAALRRAQVAEADYILNPVDQMRKEGLILDSIGQSKQMWRSSKPVTLPVCPRALRYISYFTTSAKAVGRG